MSLPVQLWALVTVICITIAVSYIFKRLFSRHGLPPSIPWAGCAEGKQGAFARAKSTLLSFFRMKDVINDGYQKYSKAGKAYILPNILTGPEVIIPHSQMPWLLNQPDHIMDQNATNVQFLAGDRTMLHPRILSDTVHKRVINREMTKWLDCYSADIVDEITTSLDDIWGSHATIKPDLLGWKAVPLYQSLLQVIARISNRVLVGLPLCRDEGYTKSSSTFARYVVIVATFLHLLPPSLRPIFAPIIQAFDMYHYRGIRKAIIPVIQSRIIEYEFGTRPCEYKNPDYSRHNDYIQWALHDAYTHFDEESIRGRDPEFIAKRLTVLTFAAIQSSVITITNVLFDIASSPNCIAIQSSLRTEVHGVVSSRPESEQWQRLALQSMTRIDSTLRESMRLWGFLSRGVMKMVKKKEGITLPSGEYIPYGMKVGVTSYSAQHDEDFWHDAMRFEPFRHLEGDDGKPHAMVSTSETFMGFSHGRHACPGRFFASNQLKLLLAQIVLRFEIQLMETRPENKWLNNSIGPPIFDTLRVRQLNLDTADNASVGEASNELNISRFNVLKLDKLTEQHMDVPGRLRFTNV
ncbi:cytochrome P450 [Eremomyces bilateralis CBS 781.70]|uniref:Cytochrome P450 n=1 Tax=Eremomyces bilateralis CBS 781.70 TaxID=1392243 RepID=A0A6G1G9N1_9PEZI|nr:cytochrome P450 [Eremomyces bilateralis CBS 781.70]KAF1814611.1 cytochrome P450 [Eremomyces bilateralis CBS 781.70]